MKCQAAFRNRFNGLLASSRTLTHLLASPARDTPQFESFVVETFQINFETRRGKIAGASLDQLAHFQIIINSAGDYHIGARRKTLEARGHVYGRAKIVEPIIQRDGDARTGVQA